MRVDDPTDQQSGLFLLGFCMNNKIDLELSELLTICVLVFILGFATAGAIVSALAEKNLQDNSKRGCHENT